KPEVPSGYTFAGGAFILAALAYRYWPVRGPLRWVARASPPPPPPPPRPPPPPPPRPAPPHRRGAGGRAGRTPARRTDTRAPPRPAAAPERPRAPPRPPAARGGLLSLAASRGFIMLVMAWGAFGFGRVGAQSPAMAAGVVGLAGAPAGPLLTASNLVARPPEE